MNIPMIITTLLVIGSLGQILSLFILLLTAYPHSKLETKLHELSDVSYKVFFFIAVLGVYFAILHIYF